MENELRKRSPRAPLVNLAQALERTLRVYDQERLHAAPADAVAKALGFTNAANGSAKSMIASLRYFGLLVRPSENVLAVSKSVETYSYAPDEGMKKAILLEFLKSPPLYHELLEKYATGLPSQATLKYDLIQKGFLPQAIDAALSAFLQSVSYAEYFKVLSPESQAEPSETTIIQPELQSEIIQNFPSQSDVSSTNRTLPAPSQEGDQIPIRLSGGRKAWLNIPNPFYESDKVRMKAQIDVLFADADNSDAP